MQAQEAEKVAIQALAWMATQEDLFTGFLAASGAGLDDVKELAGDPGFLGAVLDFILQSDDHVRGFCDSTGLGYETPMRARHSLPGGQQVNWT